MTGTLPTGLIPEIMLLKDVISCLIFDFRVEFVMTTVVFG